MTPGGAAADQAAKPRARSALAPRAALGRGDRLHRRARQGRARSRTRRRARSACWSGWKPERTAVGAGRSVPTPCPSGTYALDGAPDPARDRAGARLGARLLRLHPLQGAEQGLGPTGLAAQGATAPGSSGWPTGFSSRAISSTRRPRIWARPSSPAAAKTWLRSARRYIQRHRRRRAADAELPDHPRGRPRRARDASRASSISPGAIESAPKLTLVGKGVCFDTRRARPEAVGRHATDEEGHGRRRDDARPRACDHGRQAAGAAARAGAGGREFGRGQRHAPARHHQDAEGHHGRDRQHRCRRAGSSCATRWPRPMRENPALLVDIATLTGAARVALGPRAAGAVRQ